MFSFLKKAFEGFVKKIEGKPSADAKPKETPKPEPQPKELEKLQKKVSFLESVTKAITETKISGDQFEKIFSALELELLQNNVAVEVAEKIKERLKTDLVGKSLKRSEVSAIIKEDLHELITFILEGPTPVDIQKLAQENKPLIILFVGVNGVGKTTSIAKIASWLKQNNLTCVFAASDTFRAASIEQLEEHAKKLGIEIIKQTYGSDPAAVAFDAIKHAQARKIDVVLIDTAGRQHSNVDLMAELQKIKRVAKPHLTLLTVDSLTGNDAVEQARWFNEKIGIDGSILSKVDADEKGGALLSVAHITQKPIVFLGTGQKYEDLEKFDPNKIINRILG